MANYPFTNNNGIMSDIQYGTYDVTYPEYGVLVPNIITIDDSTNAVEFTVTGTGVLNIQARYNSGTAASPVWVNVPGIRFKRVAADYNTSHTTYGDATAATDGTGRTQMLYLPSGLTVYLVLDPTLVTNYIIKSGVVSASLSGGFGNANVELALKTKMVNFTINDSHYGGIPIDGSITVLPSV
ncbi:MAG TPA: hypothetical protein VHQ24_09135 [Lachnospiraceae bacterium]|nr:hypothetical protein [Lachnospiraceae bacterium]